MYLLSKLHCTYVISYHLTVIWILNSHVLMLLVKVYICCQTGFVCSTYLVSRFGGVEWRVDYVLSSSYVKVGLWVIVSML